MDGRNRKFILELQKKPRVRKESGFYVVDGPRMVAEIPPEELDSVYVTSHFMESPNLQMCSNILREKGYTIVTESEMKQMSDTVSPQGILAIAKQRRMRGLREFLTAAGRNPLLLILENLQDPGDLGTILRAAEAAGVSGILMNSDTVDIYAPKVVRSTMGAIFRVPFLIVDDLLPAIEAIRTGVLPGLDHMQFLAAHLKGAVDYCSLDYRKPTAIMIGNEAHGLSEVLTSVADQPIIIPMSGSVESLNAAMAATVIAFEAARQRRT